ncbi:hypothetical protein [Algoriphagus jejuensis]|uniref:hypothetical protein n=1 Tax=Algoriphagus jejuensis TaxID=419934 RepID=UPI0031D9E9E3
MKKFFLTLSLIAGFSVFSPAQHFSSYQGKVALGLGFGLPYGGYGGRITFNPASQLALFGGVGYNLVGAGYNAGMQYLVSSKKQTEFFLTAMYGYNSVIKISGADTYNDSYNGFSAGAGVRVNSNRKKGVFWDFGVLIPARSSEFQDDWDSLKKNPYIESLNKPLPVLIFAGFNFPISTM